MASITATQMAKELDISRSYLYVLKNKMDFPVHFDSERKPVWDDGWIPRLREYLAKHRPEETAKELLPYKTISIQNRRYLGSKYKLLAFIHRIVDEHCGGIATVADIFAGTGAVASAFADKKIITNDIMFSNYICHTAWFGAEAFSEQKIVQTIQFYNSLDIDEDNYMTENFADTYFSRQDCGKIGFIRENIEALYAEGEINNRERAILITALLYGMDRIANTCGHYDAYRRGTEFDKSLELCVPVPSHNLNENNQCFNMDSNELVRIMEADLVYIDPPYNSRQYCDVYHVLENVARWEKPDVHGIARKMDRSALKSDYCTLKAGEAFEDLVAHTKAKYIVLSYNNMAEKGNDRSNAKISDGQIMRILGQKGKVTVFSENHRAFSAGKSNIRENEERLFLCECFETKKEGIASALNYIGGKFDLLPQLLPQFPEHIDLFVDLFCGGCNVGINADCGKVLFNDKNGYLPSLYQTFKNTDKAVTFQVINEIIDTYHLSRANTYGYDSYGCESSGGLADYNREPFLKLRKDFNDYRERDYYYYLMLYVLHLYSFNNQIRFNRKGQFNLPVGKRDFNKKMESKLSEFIDRLKSGDYCFTSRDFREINPGEFDENSFVYADPPYLITCATYNEQGGWNEDRERELLVFLDGLHERNIRFALSNVLESKGRTNKILVHWLERNQGRYRKLDLDYSYANSNYQTKDKRNAAREVLIINYDQGR